MFDVTIGYFIANLGKLIPEVRLMQRNLHGTMCLEVSFQFLNRSLVLDCSGPTQVYTKQ